MPTRDRGPEAHAADLALVRRVADGDEAALAQLYDRYASLVYSVVSRILRDTGVAEEVLQDVFYQLWRTASRFDPARGTLAGWLLVAARNRAISRLRGRNPGGGEELLEQTLAFPFNLETALARNQLMSRVKGALGKLSSAQRQALEMAYFEGLTHTEIAQRTGEPLGTVKTRLRAALESLRRDLKV